MTTCAEIVRFFRSTAGFAIYPHEHMVIPLQATLPQTALESCIEDLLDTVDDVNLQLVNHELTVLQVPMTCVHDELQNRGLWIH